jgi:CheY-like chemotaxis protein
MTAVLLVDDDRTMVGLLGALLKLDGFDSIDGAGGKDLLALVHARRPDVILMDVHLADRDGLSLLAALKQDPQAAEIPVVMTSGLEMSAECHRLGAESFLLKPYAPERLVEVLRALTDNPQEQ